MKKALVLSLVFLLVGCNGKKKKLALARTNELELKKEDGIPVKCPYCEYGWGFILEDESNDDVIYCIWKGPKIGEVFLDNNYFYGDLDNNPITIDEELSWRGIPWKGQDAIESGDTVEDAMARIRRTQFPGKSEYLTPGRYFCFSRFTYNESINILNYVAEGGAESKRNEKRQERERHERKLQEIVRRREEFENRGKSPEQIELEKITKELKELKKEVKKNK